MQTRLRTLPLLFRLCATSALVVYGQFTPSTRSFKARRPVVVVISPVQLSRIWFSGSDRIVDSVFIRDSPESVALLELAVGLLTAQRVRDTARVAPATGGLQRELLVSSARRTWLPTNDRERLTSFVARLRSNGVQCRGGVTNSRDRCLPLSLMDGTSLVRHLTSNNLTPPDR